MVDSFSKVPYKESRRIKYVSRKNCDCATDSSYYVSEWSAPFPVFLCRGLTLEFPLFARDLNLVCTLCSQYSTPEKWAVL